jgi:xanthine/uracil/vitamin C permease (AzgA family)
MLPGITEVPETFFSMQPSLPVAFQFDFSILEKPNFYVIMFTFLFTGFFDTAGTLWESFQELISMIRKEDFREQSRHLWLMRWLRVQEL